MIKNLPDIIVLILVMAAFFGGIWVANSNGAIFGLAELPAHPTDPNKDLVGGLYNIGFNIGKLAEATNRQAAALEAFVALQSPKSNTGGL